MQTYSVKETATLLNITERAVQLKCKKANIRKKSNRYLIKEEHIKEWLNEVNETKRNEPSLIVQEFTEEEYNKLEDIIKQNPINLRDIKHLQDMIESYQNQIEYLRSSLDKKDVMMNKLIISLENHSKNLLQKNFMDAKEKGYDE